MAAYLALVGVLQLARGKV